MPEEDLLDQVKSSKKSNASTSSSSKKKCEDKAPLSRRQRKNRTRAPRDQRREHQEQNEYQNNSPSDSPLLNRNQHRNHWLHGNDRHFQDAPAQNTTLSSKPNQKEIDIQLQLKESKDIENTKSKSKNILDNESSIIESKPKKFCPSTQRDELKHLGDAALECLLRGYCLTERQMCHGGYPMKYEGKPNCAIVHSYQGLVNHRFRSHHCLDANAREFVPGNTPSSWNAVESEADSGNGSGSSVENSDLEQESSSDSDNKCSDNSESSSFSSGYKDQLILSGPAISNKSSQSDIYKSQMKCSRCSRHFHVDPRNGNYLREEQCIYHWGKRRNGSWECCRARQYDGVRGCTTAKMHVWTGIIPGITNGPLEGYVRTKPLGKIPENKCFGVYGIDCEMCFTKRGLELTKVSVVSLDGTLVYNELVKPGAEVIDYNTRFSGITDKDLANTSKTLKDVQNDLLKFINSETILIGHGLENDLRALRILHKVIVDTSFAFPHDLGPPYRRSLKTLAQYVMGKNIQVGAHDSIEDARTAMELILRRLQLDLSESSGDGIYLCMKNGPHGTR